jgi:phosphoglycolate phosphatase-like HAD superfamily hydrolase
VRPLAVFDLDGTLADVAHRVHHLEGPRKNWGGFFHAAPRDGLLAEGLALLQEASKDCDIAYVTGRPEWCRDDTEDWLARHVLPTGDLLMRRNGDHRPAHVAKLRLQERLAEGRVVAVVVDDDLDVCDAYEAAGFRVLRATWAPRSDALHRAQEEDGRT